MKYWDLIRWRSYVSLHLEFAQNIDLTYSVVIAHVMPDHKIGLTTTDNVNGSSQALFWELSRQRKSHATLATYLKTF